MVDFVREVCYPTCPFLISEVAWCAFVLFKVLQHAYRLYTILMVLRHARHRVMSDLDRRCSFSKSFQPLWSVNLILGTQRLTVLWCELLPWQYFDLRV